MRIDLKRASDYLSSIDIRVTDGTLEMEVLWLRAMLQHQEWLIKRHTHSTHEFHFVVQGSCLVKLDEQDFIIKEGQFYLTTPWMYHEQQSINTDKFIEYSLNCSYKLVQNEISEAHNLLSILNQVPCKPYQDTEKAVEYFNHAFEEACQQRLGFYSNIKQSVMKITVAAVRGIVQTVPFIYAAPYEHSENTVRMTKIKRFIQDNFADPITVDDISKYMYLSKKQVYRIVKEQLGISPKDLIIEMKLKKAKEFLNDHNLQIKEVANALGFSSQYYFNRFFKREEGCTPTTYRTGI